MTQNYQGSCHCGAVKYDVDLDLDSVITCNCSMCGRSGTVLAFVPETEFHLHSGEDDLSHYRFNKKVIDHLFCKHCGIKPFGRGTAPDGTSTIAVNVRCLEGVAVEDLKPTHYNGKDL